MQPVWFIRFGAAFFISFALCWGIPRFLTDIPDFPLINTERHQFRIVNHYFQSPAPAIALAGSSLTERLKEHYFARRDIRNIGIGGGSALTGLTLLADTAWKRPAVVAVETNIMSRGVDQELVRAFQKVDHPVATFASPRTLFALYQRKLDGFPPAFDPARCENTFRMPPAESLIIADDTATARSEHDNPYFDARIRNDVAALKVIVEELETKGIKVFLYDLPTMPALESTRYVRMTRLAMSESFSPDRWLELKYPASEIGWDDAIHFDDRSAIILACALERALNKVTLTSIDAGKFQ
jgi:hypothetical protein